MNHLHRLPFEVFPDAPPTQVVLAMAMLRIDAEERARPPGSAGHPPAPAKWRKIHSLVDRAAAFIAQRG